MASLARDIMTREPACCGPKTTLEDVAKLMVQNDCGEIPVVDVNNRVIGVVTDRDIVCRVVAAGINPLERTAESCMTPSVVTARENDSIADIISMMERHQVRRVPVVRDGGLCTGIVSQADLARIAGDHDVAELVCEVSKDTGTQALYPAG
ncbi:MAG TPA: CBS domain-containing protein [Vicinamibacterales bacterium]|nr:CBS domain-containing protein [Vicinamibacterales bacterium]